MALITKTNPKGVDLEVDLLQREIYKRLTVANSLTNIVLTNYESYPRCYKIDRDGMVLPTLFNGQEYQEILYDEKFQLTSFFNVLDDAESDNGMYKQTVDLIFQGNLKSIFPSITHRADEEFKAAIDKINFPNIEKVHVRRELDNVYNEFRFQGSVKDKMVIHNMNDLFVMRFRYKVSYISKC